LFTKHPFLTDIFTASTSELAEVIKFLDESSQKNKTKKTNSVSQPLVEPNLVESRTDTGASTAQALRMDPVAKKNTEVPSTAAEKQSSDKEFRVRRIEHEQEQLRQPVVLPSRKDRLNTYSSAAGDDDDDDDEDWQKVRKTIKVTSDVSGLPIPRNSVVNNVWKGSKRTVVENAYEFDISSISQTKGIIFIACRIVTEVCVNSCSRE
jgi:hypothetical protein